jgi:hypothetical protein
MIDAEPFVDLVKGEKLVWQGPPARPRIFRISDAVAAGWLVVVVGGTVAVFRLGFFDADERVIPVLMVVGVAIYLFSIVGTIVFRAVLWRRTGYVVTSRRVVVTGGRSGKVQAAERLIDLEAPVMTERADGSGSLAFGRFPGVRDSLVWSRIGGGRWGWISTESTLPVFWEVADVRRVHDHVVRAQEAAARRRTVRANRRRDQETRG